MRATQTKIHAFSISSPLCKQPAFCFHWCSPCPRLLWLVCACILFGPSLVLHVQCVLDVRHSQFLLLSPLLRQQVACAMAPKERTAAADFGVNYTPPRQQRVQRDDGHVDITTSTLWLRNTNAGVLTVLLNDSPSSTSFRNLMRHAKDLTPTLFARQGRNSVVFLVSAFAEI